LNITEAFESDHSYSTQLYIHHRYSVRMDPDRRSSIIGWLGSVFTATSASNSLLNLDGRGYHTGPPNLPRLSLARSSPAPSHPSLYTIPRMSYSFPDLPQYYAETQATEFFPNTRETPTSSRTIQSPRANSTQGPNPQPLRSERLQFLPPEE
jgi:hypothetical protein